MSNKNIANFIIPEATTREEQYLKFFAIGGDINSLPEPITRRDKLIYAICLVKAGISITMYPYYKAIVNTDSAAYNFIGGFYDLGENKKITNAKVKFRFTLRNTGTDNPKAIGLALLADNEPSQFVGNQYNLQIPNKIQSPEFDKEYTIEGDYLATNADKTLNAYRYIRPYIRIDKTKADKTSTHGIDIHEILLTIDDKDYDITNSTRVFSPVQNGASKVELIGGTETESKAEENTIVKEYVRALLNSGAAGQNFFNAFYDLGESKRITEAKVQFRFTLRDTGNDKPESIGAKLFANNVADRNNISEYCANFATLQANPEYDKEYTFEVPYVAVDSDQTNKQLNAYRYLKPFIVLNKTNKVQTSTHGLDIHEVTIEIEGQKYDITKTVQDFAPVQGGASKVEVIKEANVTSAKPYAGKKAGFLGNSITAGLDPDNPSKMLANPWVSQLKELCGFSEVINYGIPSTTVSTKTSDPNWNQLRQPMCLRYKNMADDLDVIGFKGSINDFWLNQPVGTPGSEDTNTIYGALNVLFKGLKEKYPGKKIMAITPIDYLDKNYGFNTNGVGTKLDEYRKAIIDTAKLHNIHVFDLQSVLSFSANNPDDKVKFIPDGLHPNQAGHNIMAPEIAEEINTNL